MQKNFSSCCKQKKWFFLDHKSQNLKSQHYSPGRTHWSHGLRMQINDTDSFTLVNQTCSPTCWHWRNWTFSWYLFEHFYFNGFYFGEEYRNLVEQTNTQMLPSLSCIIILISFSHYSPLSALQSPCT